MNIDVCNVYAKMVMCFNFFLVLLGREKKSLDLCVVGCDWNVIYYANSSVWFSNCVWFSVVYLYSVVVCTYVKASRHICHNARFRDNLAAYKCQMTLNNSKKLNATDLINNTSDLLATHIWFSWRMRSQRTLVIGRFFPLSFALALYLNP